MRPGGKERIAVGYITRARGVHGEVKVEPLTHRLSRFDELSEIVVQKEGQEDLLLQIHSWWPQPPGVVMKFAGIDTPEAASALLVKGYITIAPEQVASLPPGTFYVFELVGCRVEDEQGRHLGEITEVLAMPSTDIYVVCHQQRQFLIPAVEDFIVQVSIPQRRLVVRGVDELLQ